jgi:hypothetical protein
MLDLLANYEEVVDTYEEVILRWARADVEYRAQHAKAYIHHKRRRVDGTTRLVSDKLADALADEETAAQAEVRALADAEVKIIKQKLKQLETEIDLRRTLAANVRAAGG